MRTHKFFGACVLVGLLAASLSATAAPLITDKEAALPGAQGDLKTRGIARGPGIKMVSPDPTAAVKGAFDLKINFESRGGNKVDPASVRVTYLKSPTVDLTPRLKAAISENGIQLPKAEVPPGEHELRISVKDAEGRESNSTVKISVQK